MIDPTALITQTLQNDMQRLAVIANNSANALTPGFKRELMAASSAGTFGVADSSFGYRSPVPTIHMDHTVGTPSKTGGLLDIALLGDGYFEIKTDRGIAYTRLGRFRLDEAGFLVTQEGFRVQGQSGDVSIASPNPVVDRDGQVMENGVATGKLQIVAFNRPELLKSIGSGLMVADGQMQQVEPKRPQVMQGFLENSNVDSAREMISLVETYRHFESSVRVLQAYDDLRDKTFRNLGQF